MIFRGMVMRTFWASGTQKLRAVRAGLGESWVRLAGKRQSGTGRPEKRVSAAPDAAGESCQLCFAGESHRGTTIKRRRRLCQRAKGCRAITLGSLKGGADEGVTDQRRKICGMVGISLV